MKPQIIGDYEIGYEMVQLILRDGDGAEFYRLSGNVTIPTIIVGCGHACWWQVVACLLHEAFELVADRLGCRFYPSHNLANDNSAYLFVLDHQRFADCCAKVADFMTVALPDLAVAWKQRQKTTKKESS